METRLTRLPSKQLLLAYLELYTTKNIDRRATIANNIKNNVEHVISYVTSIDPADTAIDKIVREVEALIKNAKTWTDWYNLIFILREKAENAQHQKTFSKETDSLSRRTLHAMACLIVNELKECKFEADSEDVKYNNVLYKKVHELNENLKTTRESGLRKLHENQGTGSDDFIKKEDDILKELIMICDLVSIYEGKKHRLFEKPWYDTQYLLYKSPTMTEACQLHCGSSANLAAPLFFQEEYYKWLYTTEYQSLKKISFEEFRVQALTNETILKTMEKEIKVEELKQLKKLKENEENERKKQKEIQINIDLTEQQKKQIEGGNDKNRIMESESKVNNEVVEVTDVNNPQAAAVLPSSSTPSSPSNLRQFGQFSVPAEAGVEANKEANKEEKEEAKLEFFSSLKK